VGKRFADEDVLTASANYEAVRPWSAALTALA
jgi:hypothetical protein